MSDLAFTLVDIRPEPYAASPALTARLHLEDRGPDPVHAVALRAQVRLEPQRRAYSDAEAAGLTDLFGSRERWGSTLRPFLWMQCSTVVQGFTGSTDVDLSLPCTYDFEVAGVPVPARPARRRACRCCCCSAARSSPVGRRLRRRADALGPRGPLRAAGPRLAAS